MRSLQFLSVLLLTAPAWAQKNAVPPPYDRPAQTTPNIVVIYADDQGYSDIGVYGAQGFETPNLDQMAAEGVRFTDFYVSQPVCSASRSSLLTGCYADRLGIHGALGPNARHGLAAGETTIAELCKAQGYRTAVFGKWHLGHRQPFLPAQHGFDEWAGIPYSNDMWPGHPESPKAWPPLPWYEGEQVAFTVHEQSWFTRQLTARATQFLRSCAMEGSPFFLYVPHPMPHVPLYAGPDFHDSTEQGRYGDVISEIDWSTGEILRTLREEGLDENTLVIYTSDNGPWLSYGDHSGTCRPLREGKGTTFEGGVRVPFIARWPGKIPAGSVCSEAAMTIDVLPTIAGLLGASLPEHPIDGLDIWPLLSGAEGAQSPHEALYFWYGKNNLEAMRSGRWKLHFPHSYRTLDGKPGGKGGIPTQYRYGAKIGLSLYDLDADIGEGSNVAEQHPEVVAELTAMADRMRARLGDALTGVEGSEIRGPDRVPASAAATGGEK